MHSIQRFMVAVALLLALAVCASWPDFGLVRPATAPPEPIVLSPSPANPTVVANAEVTQLLGDLRQRGITLQGPEESRAAFLYPVPGVVYRLDGGWLHIHLFSSDKAAAQRAIQMPPEMTPSVMDWVDQPHFYRCRSAIALYLGKDARVTQALTELCGPEFAGS